jgi:mannose-1-phosphate guanylyltransferase
LKAVLLAGGHGTRGRPFTEFIPKALFPINGRPVIDYIVRYLSHSRKINEIVIICEFDNFGRQIINYFEGKEFILKKKIIFIEDKKTGTGGALLEAQKYLVNEPFFLTWFADNLCALDINKLVTEYEKVRMQDKEVTGLVVTRNMRYEETGRVMLCQRDEEDTNTLIKEFREKNLVRLEQPEALGIYLFNNTIYDFIYSTSELRNSTLDLSKDILAKIPGIGKLFSYNIGNDTEWIDAESLVYLARNKAIIDRILAQLDVTST